MGIIKKIAMKGLLSSLAVLLGLSVISAYGWLHEAKNIEHNIDKGTVIKQYFHSGEGTVDNPFVITRPIHYYHLVELYQRRSSFADKDYCFQIGCDIDGDSDIEVYEYDDTGSPTGNLSDTLNMEYYSGEYALLPVGTSAVPFDGIFMGNGLTVSNLHITATETIGDVTYGT